ncbi:MAG: hypothetical protein VYC76_00265, partial [Pseudomonadota bacterium]|nr:hypothetical protein [Pseudomonadota bacterium]
MGYFQRKPWSFRVSLAVFFFYITFRRFPSRPAGGFEIGQHLRPSLQMGRRPNFCASGGDDVAGYLKKHI